MVDLFSAPALFIVFRETLEAVIVISIMLQICDKLNLAHLKKHGTILWIPYHAGDCTSIVAQYSRHWR